MNILNKLFGSPEEINGADRCPTHMWRWVILKTPFGKVYIHRHINEDWSRDLHDHPKRFISVGLWGSYVEETESGLRKFSAPWVRSFPAEHKHRIIVPKGSCWTLAVVFKTTRVWGFWKGKSFIPWDQYVRGSESQYATSRISCK